MFNSYANIYEKQDNNLLALKNLESFNEKDLYYLKAEKLKLKILNDLDKTKEIVKNLRSLVKEFPNRIELKILTRILILRLQPITGELNGSQ